MSLQQDQLADRVQSCLNKRERLSLGEIEILRGLLSREVASQALSFLEERELRQIERKLGLAY